MAKFLVIPRIVGHTPSDTSYAARGWLHDAGPVVQRRAHELVPGDAGDVSTVYRLATAPWLERPGGVGNSAELAWWREYARILRTQVCCGRMVRSTTSSPRTDSAGLDHRGPALASGAAGVGAQRERREDRRQRQRPQNGREHRMVQRQLSALRRGSTVAPKLPHRLRQ